MEYALTCKTHEKRSDKAGLDADLTFIKDDNFKLMVQKLVESGWADSYFKDYIAGPDSVKDWAKNNPEEAASAVEDWFNDASWSFRRDSAREVYNQTISKRDIEVTIERSYYVDIEGDSFMVHVDDTWDEMYRNFDAIQLAKDNKTLGQSFLENYFDKNVNDSFKKKFERITSYKDKFGADPEKLRKASLDQLDDFDKIEKENLRNNMELIINENEINWTTVWDEE